VISPLHIAIVGYGIGGIAAAIHLRRVGHHVEHFERNDPPAAHGAGMLLHPPALRQLHKLGLLEAALAHGAPVRRIRARTVHGTPLMDFGYADLLAGQHGLGIQRGTLHRLLSSADTRRNDVRAGRTMTSLDPDRGYLFSDSCERHGPYDLIVVADGTHSRLRECIPAFAGRSREASSAALVGLLDDPERLAGDDLVQYFDSSRHLSVWPAGSESPGTPARCAVAMNVPLAEAGAFRDDGSWRGHMARLCPMTGKLLDAQVENRGLSVFSYRDVDPGTYVMGRAVLVGDAAHSMSPQLGVGAHLAMEDADILANSLAHHRDLPAALRAYGHTRPRQVRRYQRASRWITPLFQSDSRVLAAIRDRLLAGATRAFREQRLVQELLS
jgi:2-polyprenyl-6-methoxyphenol hydroxylase-like FAD-dependent oxidoreductase